MCPEGKDHIKTSTVALNFPKCDILKMRELVTKEHEMKKQRAHGRCKMETSQVYSNAVAEGILLKEI